MVLSDAETVQASFTHPNIPKYIGEPTFEVIHEVHKKLNQNATSILRGAWGNRLGLLGYTVAPNMYQQLAGQAFTEPVEPQPPNIPPFASAHQANEARRIFDEQSAQYKKAVATKRALCNQLLGAFEDMYFMALYVQATGYEDYTVRQMLDHLYTNYGQLDATMLMDNDRIIKQDYDPTKPIENDIARVEKCLDIAQNGNTPYTLNQLLTLAYDAMFRTGLYTRECIEWDEKPAADKTWPNWKLHFTKAVRDQRQIKRAQQTGYQANVVLNNNITADTIEALANLVTATADDRNVVANLTTANATLAAQVKNLTKQAKKHEEQFEEMQESLTEILRVIKKGNKKGSGNQKRGNRRNNDEADTKVYYCWTHGVTNSKWHTSCTCSNRADGHKVQATVLNRMGGSTKGLK
mmetsp:Transcript_19484/g.28690  ORF Transcript_19484/g.28690 Transcript_19484/m.28690 type:complete len:408 (+) Transcript_19484:103-1326(+)